jgi:hypothetical protein
MVIYESNAADVGWDERRLRFLLARGMAWDSPVYAPALLRAGIARLGSPDDYKRALRPRHWDILSGVYQSMAADCRTRAVPIVWVLVPRVGRPNDGADQRALKKTAQAVGFTQLVDVTDAYDGLDPASLAVDADDFHPNALAHERLAQRLDAAIGALPELARLWKGDRAQVAHHQAQLASPQSPALGAEIVVPLNRQRGAPR